MQPLFTIHAGEYLVGSHIEQKSDPRQARIPRQAALLRLVDT